MKHTGGCHCGKVRYEVEMEIGKVIECNCSICSKKGYLLSFAPSTAFKLLSGENNLNDYQFNKHIVHHLFCKTCGIGSFSKGKGPDGTEMHAINVRCLDGVDLDKLDLMPYDGRSK
jgi:hypothetical protein